MGAKKVILDSNIFISALGYDGPEREVVRKCLKREVEFYLTKEIADEIFRVINYPKFKFSAEQIDRLRLLLSEVGNVISVPHKLNLVKEDPDDNRFLECALAAGADYLITGDKHLLKLKSIGRTRILRAPEFLRFCE
jgi:putative PIN family toxin of toxin-antitoxin system